MTKIKSTIKPFVWTTNLIKDDPLKALKAEEKREKAVPKEMVPK